VSGRQARSETIPHKRDTCITGHVAKKVLEDPGEREETNTGVELVEEATKTGKFRDRVLSI